MTSNTLLNRVDTRLLACAAAAGASLTVAPESQAIVVHSGLVNINIPITTAGVYLNVVNGVSGITPASAPGWDVNLWSSTALNVWANNPASPSDGVINNFTGGSSATLTDNLPFGTSVNGALGYTFGRTSARETTGATAFNLDSINNYVGFRFLHEANGQYEYGWLQISLGATITSPRAIVGYAYESTGAGITVGATGASSVPEGGSTLPLLGLAFAGTAAACGLIRRREAKS